MDQLEEDRCIPCEGGTAPADDAEIATYLTHLPDWSVVTDNQVKHLTKTYRFDNFAHALVFTNRVGDLAEEQGHHPVLITEWGQVTVTWWTHAIGGLHRNDFVMAAQTEKAFQSSPGSL